MIRIVVDFGGTKIEAAALDESGRFVARARAANPGDYEGAIETVRELAGEVARQAGTPGATVGVGVPGSTSPRTGRMRNANSVWLNGKPFHQDLESALGQRIRLENDANCFALSEACGGAADGADVVFGAILGTGCGGGVVVRERTLEGRNRIGGEWGHTPLPWPTRDEFDAHRCWCGRGNCLETWISGTALGEAYERVTGTRAKAEAVVAAARSGEAAATRVFEAWVERLGRAFAVICDVLDPDVIVCGGGMSNVAEIYDQVVPAIRRRVFSDVFETRVVKAMHGDSSGVRGAAWLWPVEG
jgi:fructokinase